MANNRELIEKYIDELATSGDLTPAGVSYYDLLGIRIVPLPYEGLDGESHVATNMTLSPDVFIGLIKEPLCSWVEERLSDSTESRDYKELCNYFIKDVFPKKSRLFPRLYDLKAIPSVGTLVSDLIVDYVKEEFGKLTRENLIQVRRVLTGMPEEGISIPKDVEAFLNDEFKTWLYTSYRELCEGTEFGNKFNNVYTQYDVATRINKGYTSSYGSRDPASYPDSVEQYSKIRVDIHPLNFADYYLADNIVEDAIRYCPEIRDMVLSGCGPCDKLADKFKAFCTTWIKGFMMDRQNISDYAYTMVHEYESDLGINEETMLDDCIIDDSIVGDIEDIFVKDSKDVPLPHNWEELFERGR